MAPVGLRALLSPGKFARDHGQIFAPDLFRNGREDVIPDRGKAANQLRQARRASHEPPVQVLAAVAPSADVDAANMGDGSNSTFDPRQRHAQFCCQVVREIAWLAIVGSRLQDQNDWQA
ncbi:MAG: hypothetical protein ACREOY_00570 [Candidatus Dormibacteraceae bacterium]